MVEIFCGYATLCATAKAMGFTDSIAVDKFKKRGAKTAVIPLDLTCADHQALVEQWLESGQVAWVHLAPPCATASLARTLPVPGQLLRPSLYEAEMNHRVLQIFQVQIKLELMLQIFFICGVAPSFSCAH